MEIFLPSLVLLLLMAFFVFLVLPRYGTTVLVVASILSIILAGLHHWYMFNSEYRLSTWQILLSSYAPWVIMILSFFFIIAALQWVFTRPNTGFLGTAAPSPAEELTQSLTSSVNAMLGAPKPTNPLTAAINSAFTRRNSPILPGLGFSGSQV